MSPEARRAFIQAQTEVAAPPLLPEIRLHLATEVTRLWQATELELRRNDLPVPFWAFAWPGGIALARHVLDQPAQVAGRRVLDFGAGSGLAAIAAMKAGAACALAVEVDRFAVSAIALNAALNEVTVETRLGDLIGQDLPGIDLILAGDICYERPMAERAIAWFRRLVADGVEVWLADPGRNFFPSEGVVEIGRLAVPTSLDLEDQTTRQTTLWRVTADVQVPGSAATA